MFLRNSNASSGDIFGRFEMKFIQSLEKYLCFFFKVQETIFDVYWILNFFPENPQKKNVLTFWNFLFQNLSTFLDIKIFQVFLFIYLLVGFKWYLLYLWKFLNSILRTLNVWFWWVKNFVWHSQICKKSIQIPSKFFWQN